MVEFVSSSSDDVEYLLVYSLSYNYSHTLTIYTMSLLLGPDDGGVDVIGISILVVVSCAVLFLLVLITATLCITCSKLARGYNLDNTIATSHNKYHLKKYTVN